MTLNRTQRRQAARLSKRLGRLLGTVHGSTVGSVVGVPYAKVYHTAVVRTPVYGKGGRYRVNENTGRRESYGPRKTLVTKTRQIVAFVTGPIRRAIA